jgi:hypothetical protein
MFFLSISINLLPSAKLMNSEGMCISLPRPSSAIMIFCFSSTLSAISTIFAPSFWAFSAFVTKLQLPRKVNKMALLSELQLCSTSYGLVDAAKVRL